MSKDAATPANPVEYIASVVSGISAALRPSSGARVFSLTERLGRVRYLVYAMLATAACSLLLLAVYLVALYLPGSLGYLVSQIAFICVTRAVLPVIFLVLSIRRLHDMNASGWWSILVLVPFVALILACIPGSKKENNYGPLPPPNTQFLRLSAVVLPVLMVALFASYSSRHRAPPADAQQGKGVIRPYDASPSSSPVPGKAPAKPLKRYFEP